MPSYSEDEDEEVDDDDPEDSSRETRRRPRKWPNASFYESVTGDDGWQAELQRLKDQVDS